MDVGMAFEWLLGPILNCFESHLGSKLELSSFGNLKIEYQKEDANRVAKERQQEAPPTLGTTILKPRGGIKGEVNPSLEKEKRLKQCWKRTRSNLYTTCRQRLVGFLTPASRNFLREAGLIIRLFLRYYLFAFHPMSCMFLRDTGFIIRFFFDYFQLIMTLFLTTESRIFLRDAGLIIRLLLSYDQLIIKLFLTTASRNFLRDAGLIIK